MIAPTVGRKVWYRPQGLTCTELAVFDTAQPCDATVLYVWHNRMVNLQVIGPTGVIKNYQSVYLLQDDEIPPALTNGGYAEWMPYQRAVKLMEASA